VAVADVAGVGAAFFAGILAAAVAGAAAVGAADRMGQVLVAAVGFPQKPLEGRWIDFAVAVALPVLQLVHRTAVEEGLRLAQRHLRAERGHTAFQHD